MWATMLLIGAAPYELNSVRPEDVPVPTLPLGQSLAENALSRIGTDDFAVRQALRAELALACWPLPVQPSGTRALIAAAARAIAARRVKLSVALSETITVTFDRRWPFASTQEAVEIGSPAAAAHLAAWLAAHDDAARAVSAALADPAGAQSVQYRATRTARAGRPNPPQARAVVPAPGVAAWNQSDIAALLLDQSLLLVPRAPTPWLFQLAWRRPYSSGAEASPAAAAPARRPSAPRAAPPRPAGPRSVLPEAPATHSPQALALIEAAKHGIPFCEECARQAPPGYSAWPDA
jgi:hypothetical protein